MAHRTQEMLPSFKTLVAACTPSHPPNFHSKIAPISLHPSAEMRTRSEPAFHITPHPTHGLITPTMERAIPSIHSANTISTSMTTPLSSHLSSVLSVQAVKQAPSESALSPTSASTLLPAMQLSIYPSNYYEDGRRSFNKLHLLIDDNDDPREQVGQVSEPSQSTNNVASVPDASPTLNQLIHQPVSPTQISFPADKINQAKVQGSEGTHSAPPSEKEDSKNERIYACKYPGCDKHFAYLSILKVHARVHTGDRPHQCQLCDSSYTTSSRLKIHIRSHTNETPYECRHPGCGKRFKSNSNLSQHNRVHLDPHERQVLNASNKRTVACPECGNLYKTVKSMDQHMWREHKHVFHKY